MMRELKFRVFLEGNHMIVVDSASDFTLEFGNKKPFLSMFSNGGEFVDKGEVEHVMQFTGLRDKNGKEIYEGDILRGDKSQQKYEDNSCEVVDHVQYRFGSFKCFGERLDEIGNHNGDCFMVWHESGNFMNREGFYYQIRGIEVIGNIHESPELLES